MDFWLEETGKTLNCRMRIVNSGDEVIPMYWWSNMAVPEYPGGRLIVCRGGLQQQLPAGIQDPDPGSGRVDVTRYENIPSQVDYFFNIPEESPRYIANIGEDGYGLLQYSTRRLRGRKLFSWGKKRGGHRWQEFLTEEAGLMWRSRRGLGRPSTGVSPCAPQRLGMAGAIRQSPDQFRRTGSFLRGTKGPVYRADGRVDPGRRFGGDPGSYKKNGKDQGRAGL